MGVMFIQSGRFAPAGFSTITDSFNRADSTSSVGTTDTGQAWSTLSGTCGISSNEFYASAVTGAQACAVIDSGITDVRVKVTPTVFSSNRYIGVVGRCVDDSNYYLAQADTASSSLYKKVAGAFTQLGGFGAAAVAGDVLELRCVGTTISLYLNGSSLISVTDSSLTTGTKCGIRIGSSATVPRCDTFAVEAG